MQCKKKLFYIKKNCVLLEVKERKKKKQGKEGKDAQTNKGDRKKTEENKKTYKISPAGIVKFSFSFF